jgi:hypothetical protein
MSLNLQLTRNWPAGVMYRMDTFQLPAAALLVRINATGGKANTAVVESVFGTVTHATPMDEGNTEDGLDHEGDANLLCYISKLKAIVYIIATMFGG